jgi:hypothetical protein
MFALANRLVRVPQALSRFACVSLPIHMLPAEKSKHIVDECMLDDCRHNDSVKRPKKKSPLALKSQKRKKYARERKESIGVFTV